MHLSEKTHPKDFIIFNSVFEDQLPQSGFHRKISSLIPNFSIETRLAVVTKQPLDALGASNFITACVSEFYEKYRQKEDSFFIYPDYFTFQLTSQPDDPIADYGYFDIWPNNKNIRLGIGSNRIYQLIDELSIDVLLLPFVEDEKTATNFHHADANLPIEHCFVYGIDGNLDKADFFIRRSIYLLDNSVETVVKSVSNEVYAKQTFDNWQSKTHDGSWVTESYRQIGKKIGSQYLSKIIKY